MNPNSKMNPNIGLPGWELIHIYQDSEQKGFNTVLLLRRAGLFAVDKIVPYPNPIPRYHGDDGLISDADILPKMPPHPNIIKLYSSHRDVPGPGKMSLIFEFCAGGDFGQLFDHARHVGARIPETFFWHVLHQAWAAVEHMHRCGIIHNDLHMRNLFLRPAVGGAGAEGEETYPDVVLGDFETAYHQLSPDESNDDFRAVALEINYVVQTIAKQTADSAHPYSSLLMEFYRLFLGEDDRPKRVPFDREHELVQFSKTMAYGDNGGVPHRMPPWMTEYFCQLGQKFGFE
ncbi:Myosin-IIIb [Pseudocyphellaria aurata]|nr:Myosin-IIIb [Pseudocyphellaria aurata]